MKLFGYFRYNVRSGPVISGWTTRVGNCSGTFVTMFEVVLLFLVGQQVSDIARVLS